MIESSDFDAICRCYFDSVDLYDFNEIDWFHSDTVGQCRSFLAHLSGSDAIEALNSDMIDRSQTSFPG